MGRWAGCPWSVYLQINLPAHRLPDSGQMLRYRLRWFCRVRAGKNERCGFILRYSVDGLAASAD